MYKLLWLTLNSNDSCFKWGWSHCDPLVASLIETFRFLDLSFLIGQTWTIFLYWEIVPCSLSVKSLSLCCPINIYCRFFWCSHASLNSSSSDIMLYFFSLLQTSGTKPQGQIQSLLISAIFVLPENLKSHIPWCSVVSKETFTSKRWCLRAQME